MSEVIVKSRDLGDRWTGPVTPKRPMSWEQALRRWPRLVAHLIAESLGYFTVRAAANALAHHKARRSYPCEWYSYQSHCLGKGFYHEETLLKIAGDVVLYSIRNRHRHSGFMRDYRQALSLVRAELEHRGCTLGMLDSWS